MDEEVGLDHERPAPIRTILDEWFDLVEDVIQRTSDHPSRRREEERERERNRRRIAEVLERFQCLP